MKIIKPLFATAFIFLINIAHAQTVAPNAAPTVALTPSPAIAPITENPYGLAAVLSQGDWVAKTTLILLIIMSLASWYVLISKLLEQQKLRKMAAEAEDAFAKASSLQQGASAMESTSPYRFIVESSLDAVKQHPTVAKQVDLNTWAAQNIERSVATIQGNSQHGLAVLATVGSTAPFVGLFGTVWGIYNALVKIGASGQASIDKVAGPVGEALIMTAIGLAVAVPAVLGYNWLVRRNKMGMDGVRAFGSSLHTALLQDADKPQITQTK
jgi:biopolymer transport protein ExbB